MTLLVVLAILFTLGSSWHPSGTPGCNACSDLCWSWEMPALSSAWAFSFPSITSCQAFSALMWGLLETQTCATTATQTLLYLGCPPPCGLLPVQTGHSSACCVAADRRIRCPVLLGHLPSGAPCLNLCLAMQVDLRISSFRSFTCIKKVKILCSSHSI